jgi:hypothetical protein
MADESKISQRIIPKASAQSNKNCVRGHKKGHKSIIWESSRVQKSCRNKIKATKQAADQILDFTMTAD